MKNIITKHNSLIKASYRLSLMEIRIVLYGISLINPVLSKDFPTSYVLDIKKFGLLFGIEDKRLYTELKDIVIKKFWERDFSFTNEKGKVIMRRWLTDIIFHDGQGYLEIFYNPRIKSLLSDLKDHFTSYYLEKTIDFKSVYSIRVYELCIMNYKKIHKKNKCIKFRIKILELKELLMLNSEYKLFFNFKNRVLEKSKVEINKYSDLKIDYDIIKLGRSPYEVEFSVKLKKTEDDFKKAEVSLKNKDIKEKERRTNHKPIHYSSTKITTLDIHLKSVLRNLEKNID